MDTASKTTTLDTTDTYETFYAAQNRNLIGLLVSLFRLSQDDAQDAAQESFLLVWRNWTALSEKCDLERLKWVRTVACRKAIDLLRRQTSRRRFMMTPAEFHRHVTSAIGRSFEMNAGRATAETMALASEFLLAQPDEMNTDAQVIVREHVRDTLDTLTHDGPCDPYVLRTRDTLLLFANGYELQEIAEMQKRSYAAVKSDMRRARQKIREHKAMEGMVAA